MKHREPYHLWQCFTVKIDKHQLFFIVLKTAKEGNKPSFGCLFLDDNSSFSLLKKNEIL